LETADLRKSLSRNETALLAGRAADHEKIILQSQVCREKIRELYSSMTALDSDFPRSSELNAEESHLPFDSRPTPVVPLSAFLAQSSTAPPPAPAVTSRQTPSIPIPEPDDGRSNGGALPTPSVMPLEDESIPPPVRSPYAHALFVVIFLGILALLGYEISIKYHIPLSHLHLGR
jgi:hypothetical protein